MAIDTFIPVRGARRCILRSALSRFALATAVAIATCSALAFFGVLPASPQLARASEPAGAQGASGGSYGYPIKPFDAEHPIRGYFGDPRTQFLGPPTLGTVLRGSGKFSFHQGVDIS